MKKLLSTLVAAILLLGCFAALAEENSADTVFLEELGVTLDLAAIKAQCANAITLENDGVLSHDPYVAMSLVACYAIPQELLDQMIRDYDQVSEEDQQAYTQTLQAVGTVAAYIIVSDAPDQAAMLDALGPRAGEGVEVVEAAARDSWRYYIVKLPVDEFIAACDDPDIIDVKYPEGMARADQEAVRKDVGLVQSALIQQLQTGELAEPVDPSGRLIGQALEFESVDLDGNAVRSAEAVVGTGAVANGDNRYCVYVYDTDGSPVEGAFIQFCDDATCAFQPTDANGLAEFKVDVEKVYEVHVLQVPEGFRQDERAYETLESYSDVNIFLERAE